MKHQYFDFLLWWLVVDGLAPGNWRGSPGDGSLRAALCLGHGGAAKETSLTSAEETHNLKGMDPRLRPAGDKSPGVK